MNKTKQLGRVISINDLFVVIRTNGDAYPMTGEILSVQGKPDICLIAEASSEGQVFCLNIYEDMSLAHNDVVLGLTK